MRRLWAPWRSTYIKSKRDPAGCVFCEAGASQNDEQALVVCRGRFNFAMLNLYPYSSGHLMIAPFQHASRLNTITVEAAEEMMRLARLAERILEETYRPHGLNIGMNLGEAAGAGIERHIHLHVLPRWLGDANFMTTVGETRVLPEELGETFAKVKKGFEACAAGGFD